MSDGRKNAGREFLLDNLIVAVTQVLLKLRGLLALPLVVKTLGTEGYGLWTQVLSVVTFGGAILGANLHLPLIRFVAGKDTEASRAYAATVACTVALGSAGAVVLVLLSRPLAALLLGDGEHAPLLEASALLIILHNVRVLNVSLYRATNRFVIRSAVDFSSVMLELGGILVVLKMGFGLREVVLFMIVWNAAVVLATTLHALRIVGFAPPTLAIAKKALAYGLPLLPGAAAWWAIDRSDRFVIGHELGPVHVGIYSAAYALGALVLHYQVPFQVTLLPRIAEIWDTDRSRAKRYIELSTKAFLALAIPTVTGMPIVAPVALGTLANAEIAKQSAALATMVGAGVVLQGLGIMQTQIFHGARRTAPTSFAMVTSAVVNVAATILFVPRVGILGAAAATLLAYSVFFGVLVVMARPILRVDHQIGFVIKSLVASGAMTALLWVLRPERFTTLLLALAPAVLLYLAILWLLRALSAEEQTTLRGVFRRARR